MAKKDFYKEMNDLRKLTSKIKKLNESIMYEDDDEIEDNVDVNIPQEQPQQADMSEVESNSPIDTIREITLQGLTALCKTPDAPEFQTLLKIFQICNKGSEPIKDDKQLNK